MTSNLSIRGLSQGVIIPMVDQTHTREGVASAIGERDRPTSATTSSRPWWTRILTGTMDESTWLRGSMRPASGNRIYQRCHGLAMQMVNRSCAGIARWDGACTTSVVTCGKANTPVLMTFQMTLPTKSLGSSQQGFRHVCRQGGRRLPREESEEQANQSYLTPGAAHGYYRGQRGWRKT